MHLFCSLMLYCKTVFGECIMAREFLGGRNFSRNFSQFIISYLNQWFVLGELVQSADRPLGCHHKAFCGRKRGEERVRTRAWRGGESKQTLNGHVIHSELEKIFRSHVSIRPFMDTGPSGVHVMHACRGFPQPACKRSTSP